MPAIRGTKTDPGIQRTGFSITFTGAAGFGAAADVITVFTVTGRVQIVALAPFCSTTLTQNLGTPSIALGVTNSNALFIAATTATALTTGEFWTEATGGNTANSGVALPAALKDIAISNNVILTVGGTNNVNSGVLVIDCYWRPLSSNGLVA